MLLVTKALRDQDQIDNVIAIPYPKGFLGCCC